MSALDAHRPEIARALLDGSPVYVLDPKAQAPTIDMDALRASMRRVAAAFDEIIAAAHRAARQMAAMTWRLRLRPPRPQPKHVRRAERRAERRRLRMMIPAHRR